MKLNANIGAKRQINTEETSLVRHSADAGAVEFPDADFYVLSDGSTGFAPGPKNAATTATTGTPAHPSTLDTETVEAKARLKEMHRQLKPYFKARGAIQLEKAKLEGRAMRIQRKCALRILGNRQLRNSTRERGVDGAIYVLTQAEVRSLKREWGELRDQISAFERQLDELYSGVATLREEAAALRTVLPDSWKDETGGKFRFGASYGLPFVWGVSAMGLRSWRKPCEETGFRDKDFDYGLSGGKLWPGFGIWSVAMKNSGFGAGGCASLGDVGVSGGNDAMYGPKAKAFSVSFPMVGSFTSIYDPSTREALVNAKYQIPIFVDPTTLHIATLDIGVSGDFKRWQRPARFIYKALGGIQKASAAVKKKANSIEFVRNAPLNFKRLSRQLADIWVPSPYDEVSRVPRKG